MNYLSAVYSKLTMAFKLNETLANKDRELTRRCKRGQTQDTPPQQAMRLTTTWKTWAPSNLQRSLALALFFPYSQLIQHCTQFDTLWN